MLGQWVRLSYDKAKDKDCAVTYTCRYGRTFDEVGFDESVRWLCCNVMDAYTRQICDNQSWGIYEGNAGRSVYHYERTVGPHRWKSVTLTYPQHEETTTNMPSAIGADYTAGQLIAHKPRGL